MVNDIISICKYVNGTDCNSDNCLFAKPTDWCGETFMSASQWVADIDDKINWLLAVRDRILADYPM